MIEKDYNKTKRACLEGFMACLAMMCLSACNSQVVPRDYTETVKTGDSIEARYPNDGWRVIGTQAYSNARFLYYINEIRSAVMVMHGENAHSRYFGEAAYHYMVDGKAEGYNVVGKPNPVPENKQLLIIPGASHCDLYDGGSNNFIPWDKLDAFFHENLK